MNGERDLEYQRQTIERHVALEKELTDELRAARKEIADLKYRLHAMHENTAVSTATAEAACTRLVAWEPVVKAARVLCDAFERDDRIAGGAACDALVAAVKQLPPEPS